jgi:hypothetical protein
MTVVCNNTTCFNIAQPKYRVLRFGFFHLIIGRGLLIAVGSEHEAAVLLDELERSSS